MSHFVTVMALNVAPMSPNVAVMSQNGKPVPKLKVPKCHRMSTYDRILGKILFDSRRRPVRKSNAIALASQALYVDTKVQPLL